jgi:hypothetical protein
MPTARVSRPRAGILYLPTLKRYYPFHICQVDVKADTSGPPLRRIGSVSWVA